MTDKFTICFNDGQESTYEMTLARALFEVANEVTCVTMPFAKATFKRMIIAVLMMRTSMCQDTDCEAMRDVLHIKWMDNPTEVFIQMGRLDVLDWAWLHGWRVDTNAARMAAEQDRRDILIWLIEHGVDLEGALDYAIEVGSIELLDWLCDHPAGTYYCDLYGAAVRFGRLNVIEWALATDVPMDREDVCVTAIIHNKIDILKWLFERGLCPKNKRLYQVAMESDQTSIADWLVANGFPICKFHRPQPLWGAEVCQQAAAAKGRHLDILEWMRGPLHDPPNSHRAAAGEEQKKAAAQTQENNVIGVVNFLRAKKLTIVATLALFVCEAYCALMTLSVPPYARSNFRTSESTTIIA